MWETPAKLISSVVVGLGTPESLLLQESEVADVVFRKLAFYYEGFRQSDQNILAEKTSEFTLSANANSKDLTSLTSSEIIIPLWAERKAHDGTNDSWEFVPTVNLDTLPEYRANGRVAVSFHGDTPNQVTAEFSVYGDETSSPNSTYRVWYAPANSFSASRDATVAIPDTLTPLIVTDSKLALIPLLVVNASKHLSKQPDLSARIAAWNSMVEELRIEKAEWTKHYEGFRRKSRGFHRAVNHQHILEDIHF